MKLRRSIPVLVVSMVLLAANETRAGDLKNLIPNLFGPGGITLLPVEFPPGTFHQPHLQTESAAELTTLNDALRGQLGNFPLPSPASGFTFQFDPALGTFTRSTESFGPIFADRAETVGRRKLSLGFSYQHVTYDKLDGKNLDDGELQLIFVHDPPTDEATRIFQDDTITAQIYADITTDLFVLSGTYGLLDNLDVSVAIPIVRNSMRVRGVATSNNQSFQRGQVLPFNHKLTVRSNFEGLQRLWSGLGHRGGTPWPGP